MGTYLRQVPLQNEHLKDKQVTKMDAGTIS